MASVASGATSYNWTITNGTITAGAGTNSILVGDNGTASSVEVDLSGFNGAVAISSPAVS